MSVGMFFMGLFTVARSASGETTCHLYPVHLRGTGESFAANIGGRMIGTGAAALTTFIAKSLLSGDNRPLKFSIAAAIVGTTIYVIGFVVSFALPEPKGEQDKL